MKMQPARLFSVAVSDMISKQADSAMASLTTATNVMEKADWAHMDASTIEMLCDEIGRGRDFLNSLSHEDYQAIEAAKGTASAVDRAEQMLVSCMKSDEINDKAHHLKMEMEDKGTAGDGDCRPENWQAAWGEELDSVFHEYAQLLEDTHPDDVVKVERSVGYQLLLLKRVVHVDAFRYLYPKVHPSGFSASSD